MSPPRRRVIAAALALALTLGSTPLLATPAPSLTVDGRVFDSDLATPMPNLRVSAYPAGSAEPAATASTDRRGRFRLENLAGGAYLLLLAEENGTPLAAAEIATVAGRDQVVTLAIPERDASGGALAPAASAEHGEDEDEGEGNGEEEGDTPRGESRFAKWLKTPLGATIAILISAISLSFAADEFTDENPRIPESDILP